MTTQATQEPRGLARGWMAVLAMAAGALATAGVGSAEEAQARSGWERFFRDNVSFSGRLHPQYDYLESDLSGTSVADPEVAKRDFFRRAFAGVKVTLNERLRVNYLTDVSDWVVKNQIARLEWRPNDLDTFYFGYQKAPFGYEDTTSSSKVKPIERSANTRFWNEVVGIGSYHSGVYYQRDLGSDLSSTFGLTHNVKSQSDWPDVFDGDVSLYLRLEKKGGASAGNALNYGLDLGYQPYGDGREILAVSAFGNAEWAGNQFALEGTAGSIDLAGGATADAFGWHAQVSRMFGEKLEGVARVAQVDTGGYRLKLSSAIRKAPNSGFTYEEVNSLYLGFNYYLQGNDVKLSLGYELAEGDDALSGPTDLDTVSESISGFRVRGQLMF